MKNLASLIILAAICAEEMVLVLEGRVEMLIGENAFTATAGDVFFIEAEILHSLRNVGDETTKYFAFQWM